MARRANLNVVLHIPDEYKLSGYEDNIDHCLVRASREPKSRACPECGCRGHLHGRKPRKVYHTPVGGKPLFVVLEVVRFRCPGCGRTYYDDYGDLMSGVSPHMTADVASAITVDIVDKMSMAAIARKEGPGVSMCNKVRARVTGKKAVDAEGNVLRGDKFTADEKKQIKKARYDFRVKRERLEEMDFAYATDLAERRERLREMLVGISEPDLDALLPKPRAAKAVKVDALLMWDWELRAAYGLLQLFYLWSDSKWCAAKRDGLEEWCKMAADSHIPEFKTVARTFRKHREGILNGYRYDKTNATAEGLNNTIKLLKKNAYGYKSFARMRRRCLFTLGYYRLVKLQAHLGDVDAGAPTRR